MLAEAITPELPKIKEPENFEENREIAIEGGSVAGNARRDIEKRSGRPVMTPQNAIDLSKVLGTILDNGENNED